MIPAVASWIQYAEMDFKAKNALKSIDDLETIFAFHCQQAVEKLFKALLTKHELVPPKIHDLIRLCKLLPEDAFNEISKYEPYLEELNSIYIDSRYPADLALLPTNFLTQEDIDIIDRATDELFHALLNLIDTDSISKD
jgi:HEPN domain-containing protein